MKRSILLVCISTMILAITAASGFGADFNQTPAKPAAKPAPATCASSCGAPAPQQNQTPELKLAVWQQRKLAALDARRTQDEKLLPDKLTAKTNELVELINDPNSSDSEIARVMHERADILADLQLMGIFAERAKDRVYTVQQKAVLSNSAGGCGCGCSNPAPSPNPALHSGGCGCG
ncbi:MAG TPA: hypothetical protein VMX94_02440 [Armatimonadota bacterium]|nr:hypothetical protein [Armatimonadota bacterium]